MLLMDYKEIWNELEEKMNKANDMNINDDILFYLFENLINHYYAVNNIANAERMEVVLDEASQLYDNLKNDMYYNKRFITGEEKKILQEIARDLEIFIKSYTAEYNNILEEKYSYKEEKIKNKFPNQTIEEIRKLYEPADIHKINYNL